MPRITVITEDRDSYGPALRRLFDDSESQPWVEIPMRDRTIPTTCPAVCQQTGCVCVHAWAGCPSEVRCLFPLTDEH